MKRWDLVDPQTVLISYLQAKRDAQTTSEVLVKRVLDLGAHDNVSVICVKLEALSSSFQTQPNSKTNH